ncbi:hypothetical protein NQ317_004095, partial [Molorchus minor]
KGKKRLWVRPYLARRQVLSSTLWNDLCLDDFLFQNFTRMSRSDFELLVNKLGPIIIKETTNMRDPIPVTTKLAITLKFLATGDSYRSLMYQFRVSNSCISKFIPTVCRAIGEVLHEFIKCESYECEPIVNWVCLPVKEEKKELPTGPEDWKQVAHDYEAIWNFPHCLGAMDGKHIRIKCPKKAGSHYFNYKKFHSIVLFAVVDAHYRFLYVNVGCQGRISDGGVVAHTSFGRALDENRLSIPSPEPLSGRKKKKRHTFLLQMTPFPLTENILKPYACDLIKGSPKRVCNYRISRARRVVENVFGLLSSVFRIFQRSMEIDVETVKCATLATTYLHNFLRRNKYARQIYTPPGSLDIDDTASNTTIPGTWRQDTNGDSFTPLQKKQEKAPTAAELNRDEFT